MLQYTIFYVIAHNYVDFQRLNYTNYKQLNNKDKDFKMFWIYEIQ